MAEHYTGAWGTGWRRRCARRIAESSACAFSCACGRCALKAARDPFRWRALRRGSARGRLSWVLVHGCALLRTPPGRGSWRIHWIPRASRLSLVRLKHGGARALPHQVHPHPRLPRSGCLFLHLVQVCGCPWRHTSYCVSARPGGRHCPCAETLRDVVVTSKPRPRLTQDARLSHARMYARAYTDRHTQTR